MNINNILLWIVSVEHIYLLIWSIALLSVLLSKKNPTSTASWILTITIFPVFGLIAYLFLGINWRQRTFLNNLKNTKNNTVFKTLNSNLLKHNTASYFGLKNNSKQRVDEVLSKTNLSPDAREVVSLLYNSEKTLPSLNESYEIYSDGKSAFDALLKDIMEAKETIFMEYFIWRSDALGVKIKDALVKKAKEGVKIKIIFDGVGSFFTISRRYKRELEKAGVEFFYFLNIKTSLLKLNYRNHRKMTIVDGRILHSGGMNLGLEYITGGRRFKSWRDTNFRIVGDMALYYLTVFATDWLNSGGKFNFDIFEELIKNRKILENGYLMQLSSSGPDSAYPSLKYLYTRFITNAKKEILIQSPYFIPNTSILQQLKIAALSGVKIKLMTTGVPDKRIPYWVADTFIEELLIAGIEVYRYETGFFHAKAMCYDDEICTIGTCNFDSRSFDIHYEINTVFYDKRIASEFKEQFSKDLENCRKLTLEKYQNQGIFYKVRNSIFRLISPLL
ncbi:MAG: cardiolipin synthase [Campylobacteraceae bacterium]|nr:cardiolipin synthase [Campylobacteraceae bacterium]